MKVVRHLLLTLLLLLPVVLSAAETHTISVPPFTVQFDARDQAFAQFVSTTLTVWKQRLDDEFGYDDIRKPTVVIAASAEEFRRIGGASFPHWGAAMAAPDRNLILLKSPRWASIGKSWDSLIAHELTHLYLFHITRGHPIPTWLNEGLAVRMSLEITASRKAQFSKGILSGRLMPLSDLHRLYHLPGPQAQLGYTEAELAVEYFLERFGKTSLIQLLSGIDRGEDFSTVFAQVTGTEQATFEREWLKAMKRRFFFYAILDVNTYVWTGIVVLFLLAVWAVWRRNRKIRDRWKREEERYGYTDDAEEESDFNPFDW